MDNLFSPVSKKERKKKSFEGDENHGRGSLERIDEHDLKLLFKDDTFYIKFIPTIIRSLEDRLKNSSKIHRPSKI